MNLAADPYVDILDLLLTPCVEGGESEAPTNMTAAPGFQECTDCNGLDTNFLDQFTALDTILNMDTWQQTLYSLNSSNSTDENLFLPIVATPSPSSIGTASDLATPTSLYSPVLVTPGNSTFTLHVDGEVYEEGPLAFLHTNTDGVTSTSTTPPTTPLSLTTTPSSASPLSLLYNALSPHKLLPQDAQDDSNPPSAKRPRSSGSSSSSTTGLGKRGPKYAERRQKNNEASKVSRRKRKERYEEMAAREEKLREENARLRRQVKEMANETSLLKALLVSRLAGQRTVC